MNKEKRNRQGIVEIGLLRFGLCETVNSLVVHTKRMLLLVLLVCLTSCTSDGISLDEATDIVIEEILHNDMQGIDLYRLPTKVNAGEDIGNPIISYELQRDAWFFFIDDAPSGHWPHPCRYVFVYCEDGDYYLMDQEWPPDNFDDLRWVSD